MKKISMKKATAAVLAIAMAAAAMTGCGKKEEAYPNDAIQMIVPVKAGGDTDANARLFSQYMEKELGVSMPVVKVAG